MQILYTLGNQKIKINSDLLYCNTHFIKVPQNKQSRISENLCFYFAKNKCVCLSEFHFSSPNTCLESSPFTEIFTAVYLS